MSLSACYFCGTIEGSLSERPVVPDGLLADPDAQRSVTVCPECGEKLAAVRETIAEAAGATGSPDDGGAETTGAPATPVAEASAANDDDTANANEAGGEDGDGDDDGEGAGRNDEPLPEGARQVLRLLRNRELPVNRGEIETVAESAYGLGPTEARESIDALLDRGLLIEEEGRLDRGPD